LRPKLNGCKRASENLFVVSPELKFSSDVGRDCAKWSIVVSETVIRRDVTVESLSAIVAELEPIYDRLGGFRYMFPLVREYLATSPYDHIVHQVRGKYDGVRTLLR
jgi:hypothetical protein